MPRIKNPLDRSRDRKRIQVGDKVEWSITPDEAEQGVVLMVRPGGEWIQVEYGPERFVTIIEAIRARIIR